MNRYTNEYAYMRIIPLESLLSLYAEPRCNARENCNAMVNVGVLEHICEGADYDFAGAQGRGWRCADVA